MIIEIPNYQLLFIFKLCYPFKMHVSFFVIEKFMQDYAKSNSNLIQIYNDMKAKIYKEWRMSLIFARDQTMEIISR